MGSNSGDGQVPKFPDISGIVYLLMIMVTVPLATFGGDAAGRVGAGARGVDGGGVSVLSGSRPRPRAQAIMQW